MQLPVEESEFVACDVLDILRHLRRHNPDAATRFLAAFTRTIDLLAGMPLLGRLRMDLGTPAVRSWCVGGFSNYLIFHETLPGRLRLLRVLHAARDLQAELGR